MTRTVPRLAAVCTFLLFGAACSSGASSDRASNTSAAPTTGAAAPAPRVALEPIVEGLHNPDALAVRRDDPALYVAEQYTARVMRVAGGRIAPTVFLDLHGAVSKGNEQGLLGLAFSPDGRMVYVDYTDPKGDTHVDEYRVSAAGTAEPASRRQVLFQAQPYPNHNGGEVTFGPDGMLYVGLGDGGSADDPDNRGQNRDTLLAKILRIDPHPNGARPYTIPAGNPFVGIAHARPETWMWGLRNPWRFSFDRETHALWIGDVGQDRYEEIDYAPPGAKGLNYEWSLREAKFAFQHQDRPAGGVDPVYTYAHADGACSVTGGFVYRGAAIAALRGMYVFADFCAGNLLAFDSRSTTAASAHVVSLHAHVDQLTSFGENAAGDLYALARSGSVYLVTAAEGA